MRCHLKGSSLFAPVPAVLVTSGTADGEKSIMTASWTGIVNTRPPMVYLSIRPERHSYSVIKKCGQFVLNLTTAELARQVDFCGMKSGKNTDKLSVCGFSLIPSETVLCPALEQCPVSLECAVRDNIPLGSHTMFIADVTGVSVDRRIISKDGRIDLARAGLLVYAHGEYFGLGKKLGDFGFSVRKKGKRKNEHY